MSAPSDVRLLIDMNLSVEWVSALGREGCASAHWSLVGDPRADDRTIMAWARQAGYVVFTHDLDFGTLLALTHAAGPSVLQLRSPDPLPRTMMPLVMSVLRQQREALLAGALVTVDALHARVRTLPLR
jgi:predicted nuclease of predicted toxin-antitoxin system